MKRREKQAGLLRALRATFLASAAIWQANPSHLADAFFAEESPLRKRLLKFYARFEVQLLGVMYWLLNQPFMSNKWIRKFTWYSAAKFMAQLAIVSQVMTLKEMEEFIEGLPADSEIAVGPCRCRLATHACDHPLETDIVIMTGTRIWLDLFTKDYRIISKEETIGIVRNCYELGLVPMVDRHMYLGGNANYFVICNCCGCSCLPIIGFRTFKEDGYRYIPSLYRSVTDSELCQGDGACVEVCAFNERLVRGRKAMVLDCQGCGQCVRVCPNGACSMVKR